MLWLGLCSCIIPIVASILPSIGSGIGNRDISYQYEYDDEDGDTSWIILLFNRYDESYVGYKAQHHLLPFFLLAFLQYQYHDK